MSADGTSTPSLAPETFDREEWVPVEERVAGFDRRSIWPGVVLLVVWVVWAFAMPAGNAVLDFDDATAAGDVIDLGDGEFTMITAPGWQLEEGVRTTADAEVGVGAGAVLSRELVTIEVSTAVWQDDTTALLDRTLEISDALGDIPVADVRDRIEIANVDGVTGQAASFVGADEQGLVVAYVFDQGPVPVGVTAVLSGDPDAPDDVGEDLATMVAGITYRPAGTDGEETADR
jgi:hypothetical protein